MKRIFTIESGSTIFLRLAVSVISLGILALCIFLLPVIWGSAYEVGPDYGYAVRIVIGLMYLAAIPFYVGIYKGWQVLNAIDRGQAFSMQPVRALRVIARCAVVIALIYLISSPFFYIWTQGDDAPGLCVICMFLVGMSLIIGVAMSILARLLGEAVRLKSENDLTV